MNTTNNHNLRGCAGKVPPVAPKNVSPREPMLMTAFLLENLGSLSTRSFLASNVSTA